MTRTSTPSIRSFGKYRDLLIAIALFLVLDLGVLLFNFYNSRQIEADTALINHAAELRMYSQQLTKSLLTLEVETRSGMPVQSSLTQIVQSRSAFDVALEKLAQTVDGGEEIALMADPTTRVDGLDLIGQIEKTWRPIDQEIQPFLYDPAPALELVEIASTKAVARNVRLMQNADDLVKHLEGIALNKSRLMRSIQLAAILLATLNFLFIVFKFLRTLSASDRVADAAREETRQILDTVQEGLFLVNNNWRIGGQHSAALDAMLGRPIAPGDDFRKLLRSLFSAADAEAAENFVEVLFNRKVKAGLLEQLNPLQEIELIANPTRRGSRYLSFAFSQIHSATGEIDAILLTVFDVSPKVHLQHELAASEERAKGDVELLLGVLDQDPRSVKAFIAATRARLDEINRQLEAAGGDAETYRQLASRIMRTIHGIKGEAAALGTTTVERQAHAFEDRLAPLTRQADLSGDDLIPVAVGMKALLEQVLRVDTVIERVLRFSSAAGSQDDDRTHLRSLLTQAEHLALKVAADLNKKVRVEVAAPGISTLPAAQGRLLAETLPQLIRNAVVHGIESREGRIQRGKPETGTIRIEVNLADDGGLLVSVRDDGCGLSTEQLRRDLVARGFRSAEQVAAMNDNEIVATIFESGFSSREHVDAHGGRGEGLARVRELLAEAGGRLRIFSEPNTYTQFLFQLRVAKRANA